MIDIQCTVDRVVVLDLGREMLRGRIVGVDRDFNWIDLDDIEDFASSEKIIGIMKIFKREILKLTIVSNGNRNILNNHSNCTEQIDENTSQDLSSASPITIDELEKIKNQIHAAKYIYQCDHSYHNAIKLCHQQEFIGLNVESGQNGRMGATSIISISTPTNIYLFDIMMLGKVHNDLRSLLQCKYPIKVVHNCGLMADHLFHKQGVQLTSIFDTMAAAILSTDDKEPLPLNECLTAFLKLPDVNGDKEKVDLTKRPWNNQMQTYATNNIAYLLTLKSYFVNEHMLRPFYKLCGNYANTFRNNSDQVDNAFNIIYRRNNGLDQLKEFELPIHHEILHKNNSLEKLSNRS